MKKNTVMSKKELITKTMGAFKLLGSESKIVDEELQITNDGQVSKMKIEYSDKDDEHLQHFGMTCEYIQKMMLIYYYNMIGLDMKLREPYTIQGRVDGDNIADTMQYNGPIPICLKAIIPVIISNEEYKDLGNIEITCLQLIENLNIVFLDTATNELLIDFITNYIPDIQTLAFTNLERCLIEQLTFFKELYGQKGIYGVSGSGLGSKVMPGLVFCTSFKAKMMEAVGDEYLFAFPTKDSLIFCRNSEDNFSRLKLIIENIQSDMRLTNNIYLSRESAYSTVEKVI